MANATERIKPARTADSEYSEETDADGNPVPVVVEHFRQGDHFYRITWRGDFPPVVEDESDPAAAQTAAALSSAASETSGATSSTPDGAAE